MTTVKSNKQPFVLALTGPSGSGKTTIGEKLAKKLDKCVNIDADHIKHMIPSGFYKDDKNPGGWSFSEWELAGESVGLLVDNFLQKGYSVIINGYIDPPVWKEITKKVELTHKILLKPNVIENYVRDSKRTEEIRMGQAAIDRHHAHFTLEDFYKDFTKLDTSNHSVEESVNAVIGIMKLEQSKGENL